MADGNKTVDGELLHDVLQGDQAALGIWTDRLKESGEPGLAALLERLDELLITRLQANLSVTVTKRKEYFSNESRLVGWLVNVLYKGDSILDFEIPT